MFVTQWCCDPRYSPNATRVYTVLVTYADVGTRNTEKGHPYLKEIARQSGISRSTARAALAELVIAGIVTITERVNPRDTRINDANLYELHDADFFNGAWVDPLPQGLTARKALEQGGFLSSKGGYLATPTGPYSESEGRSGSRPGVPKRAGEPTEGGRDPEGGCVGEPTEGGRVPDHQEVKSLFHSPFKNQISLSKPLSSESAARQAPSAEREKSLRSKDENPAPAEASVVKVSAGESIAGRSPAGMSNIDSSAPNGHAWKPDPNRVMDAYAKTWRLKRPGRPSKALAVGIGDQAEVILREAPTEAMQAHLVRLAEEMAERGWGDLEMHLQKNPLPKGDLPFGD